MYMSALVEKGLGQIQLTCRQWYLEKFWLGKSNLYNTNPLPSPPAISSILLFGSSFLF